MTQRLKFCRFVTGHQTPFHLIIIGEEGLGGDDDDDDYAGDGDGDDGTCDSDLVVKF